jgi:tRNA modification GTPase
MLGKLIGWDDTIAAPATAPGPGALALLRLSGPHALQIIDQLFPSKRISTQPNHTLHVGNLVHQGETLDEVVVSLYKAPRSYTGEDTIEISCHGSPYIQERILDALIHNGARIARPGEFTQRAFLKGKMDLVQAEAVADLIASNNQSAQRSALYQMRGGFSAELRQLREQLISFSALIELELDFSQEDVQFADRWKFYELIESALNTTGALIESFRLGNVIRHGVQVAIIGRPNSGKSTLLNALLNEERAIVSEIAGTTRDTVEEVLNIDGIPFRLIDTAGIRDHSSDHIENIGIRRSLDKIQAADIIIHLFDAADPEESVTQVLTRQAAWQAPASVSGKTILPVANKIDQLPLVHIEQKFSAHPEILQLSAKNHLRLDQLKQKLVRSVLANRTHVGESLLTNERHLQALKKVQQSLDSIRQGLDQQLSGDLLSPDIRQCLHWLGEITGEITTEDQLDYIFSKFCIGK